MDGKHFETVKPENKPTAYAMTIGRQWFFIDNIDRFMMIFNFDIEKWEDSDLINHYDPEYLKEKYHEKISKLLMKVARKWFPHEDMRIYLILDNEYKQEI